MTNDVLRTPLQAFTVDYCNAGLADRGADKTAAISAEHYGSPSVREFTSQSQYDSSPLTSGMAVTVSYFQERSTLRNIKKSFLAYKER